MSYSIISNVKDINFQKIIINIHGLSTSFQTIENKICDFEYRSNIFKLFNIASVGIEFNCYGKNGNIENYNHIVNQLYFIIKKYFRYNKPIYILAESLGCSLTLLLIKKFNIKFDGVIFLAPLIKPTYKLDNISKNFLYLVNNFIDKKIKRDYPKGISIQHYLLKKQSKDYYTDDFKLSTLLKCFEISDLLKNYDKKIDNLLIIHGNKDPTTCFKESKEFCKKLNGEFIEIETTSHYLLVERLPYDILPEKVFNSILKKVILN